MITVRDIEQFLYDWAPPDTAESWDNVGLLVGRPDRPVRRVLVALDVTPAVAAEAAELGADLIVAHHPVMNVRWHEREMQTLRDDTRLGGLLTCLVRQDLSVICMHTNLDAAEGGVNDCLAQKLGLSGTIPLNEQKIGRIGTLSCEIPLEQFLHDVVKSLSCRGLRYRDGGRPVHRVAVGGGACGEYIPQALAQDCDTFVTSDLRYNDFLDTRGLNLIDAGHFPTENVVCPEVVHRLRKAFPGHLRLKIGGPPGRRAILYDRRRVITMSGHSKWHNIQKTKGAADAKRSATFTKIAKEIIVAVQAGRQLRRPRQQLPPGHRGGQGQGRQYAQRQHQAHHRQGAGLRQHRQLRVRHLRGLRPLRRGRHRGGPDRQPPAHRPRDPPLLR